MPTKQFRLLSVVRCMVLGILLVASVAPSRSEESRNYYTDFRGGDGQEPSVVESAPPYEDVAPADDIIPDLGDFSGGYAAAGESAAAGMIGGYIDPARLATRVRIRYDDAHGANAATRAEMFYPTIAGLGGPGPAMVVMNDDIDFQELSTYVELSLTQRLSIFGEFPIRWVRPINGGTNQGSGDVKAGFRFAIRDTASDALTFQLRIYSPSGSASDAVGVGHASIEPALLYQGQVNDRVNVFAELQDWINVSNDTLAVNAQNGAFAGQTLDANVLRYGVGVGYDVWQECNCGNRRLTGVFEIVGWSVLDGFTTPIDGAGVTTDASGDTIINGKYGVRYSNGSNSVYAGYGHNWTDDLWYSDFFRLEVTHAF